MNYKTLDLNVELSGQVCISRDGQQIFSYENDVLKILKLGENSIDCVEILLEQDQISDMHLGQNEQDLFIGHSNGTISIIDTRNYGERFFLKKHVGAVVDISEKNNNHIFYSCGVDSQIIVWDLIKRVPIEQIKNHISPIGDFCISQDESFIIVGHQDGTVGKIDLTTREYNIIGKQIGEILKVHINDYDTRLVSWSRSQIKIWRLDQIDKNPYTLKTGTELTKKFFITKDDQILIVQLQTCVKIWNLEDPLSLPKEIDLGTKFLKVLLQKEEQILYILMEDRVLQYWDLKRNLEGIILDKEVDDILLNKDESMLFLIKSQSKNSVKKNLKIIMLNHSYPTFQEIFRENLQLNSSIIDKDLNFIICAYQNLLIGYDILTQERIIIREFIGSKILFLNFDKKNKIIFTSNSDENLYQISYNENKNFKFKQLDSELENFVQQETSRFIFPSDKSNSFEIKFNNNTKSHIFDKISKKHVILQEKQILIFQENNNGENPLRILSLPEEQQLVNGYYMSKNDLVYYWTIDNGVYFISIDEDEKINKKILQLKTALITEMRICQKTNIIFLGQQNGKIRCLIYNKDQSKHDFKQQLVLKHKQQINQFIVHKNYLFSCSEDGYVYAFNILNFNQPPQIILKSEQGIQKIILNKKTNQLAAICNDMSIKIQNIFFPSRYQKVLIGNKNQTINIHLGQNSDNVYTISERGEIRKWSLNNKDLIKFSCYCFVKAIFWQRPCQIDEIYINGLKNLMNLSIFLILSLSTDSLNYLFQGDHNIIVSDALVQMIEFYKDLKNSDSKILEKFYRQLQKFSQNHKIFHFNRVPTGGSIQNEVFFIQHKSFDISVMKQKKNFLKYLKAHIKRIFQKVIEITVSRKREFHIISYNSLRTLIKNQNFDQNIDYFITYNFTKNVIEKYNVQLKKRNIVQIDPLFKGIDQTEHLFEQNMMEKENFQILETSFPINIDLGSEQSIELFLVLEQTNEQILESFNQVIIEKYHKIRFIKIMNIMIFFIFWLCLLFIRIKMDDSNNHQIKNKVLNYVMIATFIIFITRETLIMQYNVRKYLSDLTNWFDIVIIALFVYERYQFWNIDSLLDIMSEKQTSFNWIINVILFFLLTIRLIYELTVFGYMNQIILQYLGVAKSIIPFLIFFCFYQLSYGFMQYTILFLSSYDEYKGLENDYFQEKDTLLEKIQNSNQSLIELSDTQSFFKYVLSGVDIAFGNYETGQDRDIYDQILFLFTLISNTIILFNLLIAIVNAEYENVVSQKDHLYRKNQVRTIIENDIYIYQITAFYRLFSKQNEEKHLKLFQFAVPLERAQELQEQYDNDAQNYPGDNDNQNVEQFQINFMKRFDSQISDVYLQFQYQKERRQKTDEKFDKMQNDIEYLKEMMKLLLQNQNIPIPQQIEKKETFLQTISFQKQQTFQEQQNKRRWDLTSQISDIQQKKEENKDEIISRNDEINDEDPLRKYSSRQFNL